jgi:hypothetical protein
MAFKEKMKITKNSPEELFKALIDFKGGVTNPAILSLMYDLSQLVRKTPSLQGGDISTNLLIFDVFFHNI